MKKKSIIAFIFLWICLVAAAVPAKRGMWRTVQLSDGTEVSVQLCGDEGFHFYIDEAGNRYQKNEVGRFQKIEISKLKKRMKDRGARMSRSRRVEATDKSIFRGTKRGLIILVNFKDVVFSPQNTRDYYNRIANEKNFRDNNGFVGSIQDYFRDQSYGQFTLQFDVVGPVTLPETCAYYGGNNEHGNDKNVGVMVAQACQLVDDVVDFSQYDWNDDGVVDQVYVIYAGQGEADSFGAENTIWPQSWTLSESEFGHALTLDNVKIDQYACSNELDSEMRIEGIGIICHEFSHCMGFPDTYDVFSSGSFGMGNWDLMDSGNYAGGGFIPVGYTAYERMLCGWNKPVELLGDTIVSRVEPVEDGGRTFIIYNKAHRDEYYLLENRVKKGWDSQLPSEGMLITHVDYDKNAWDYNVVNTIGDFTIGGKPLFTNDHQHLTIIHADNDDDSDYWSEQAHAFWKHTEEGDPYPYLYNDSLTNRSAPAAILYNKNLNDRKLMNVRLFGIKRLEGGDMSFAFEDFSTQVDTLAVGVIFKETFDMCDGVGGNDGIWGGGAAGSGVFDPDYEDWTGKKMFGANKCAKFGSNSTPGVVSTPEFIVNGTAEFSFKAAPFGSDGKGLQLAVSGGAEIDNTSFTLAENQWTVCTATIKAHGPVVVTFKPDKRVFLDEVTAVAQGGMKGDVNGDGVVDMNDVNALVNLILAGGNFNLTETDIDGNGVVDVSDVTALINLIHSL